MEHEIDRIECAIRHIESSVDIDPWACEIAVNAMQELIKRTRGWIPVTERLPEYDFTDVLICLHDVRHGCEDDYYIIQAYTVRGHWKPTLDISMDDLNVVAWMPLPEPWREGQDEVN